MSFTFGRYLRDKSATIVTCVVAIVFIALILIVLAVPRDAIILISLVLASTAIFCLCIDYWRRRSFWKNLEQTVSSLDKSSYFSDLVSEPAFLEGRLAYDATEQLLAQASAEINAFKTVEAEHKEYIELWVHEIKTPIAAIKLLLSKMHGPDATKLKLELERLEGLTQQALFAARADTLVNDYLIREINLTDLVSEACKANMQHLTSSGVSINISIDPECAVFADESWMEFILSQLIINSAKYDASLITFTATEPEAENSEAATILEICDNGCGIPAADVPRVFNRGFTGEVGRAHGSATGMGLFLVARMCAQMGLSIKLASEEGVGTRVLISFPHDKRQIKMTTS